MRVHNNESCTHLQNYTLVYTNMAAVQNLVLNEEWTKAVKSKMKR